jgi:TrmH family RNA methyltransferase
VAAGRFLAEGPQAVREALGSPDLVVEVYATTDASARHEELRRRADAAGVTWHETGADVVEAISSTVHPQGLVAVCRFVDVPLDTALDTTLDTEPDTAPDITPDSTPARRLRLVVIGIDVSDPGNAGTVVRCADAAGADAVVFCGSGVDPYNPKAVRASVGSLFHLPLVLEADPAVAVAAVRAAGLQVLAADGAAGLDLDGAEASGLLSAPTAWLLGNEAHGLGPAGLALADTAVAVPLYGRAESLNLATAAAVCLYASARVQRSMPTSGDARA